MKPVAIFRHLPWEGAGYFGELLTRKDIPSQLIKVDQGEAIPKQANAYSGLVFMGGSMSVNDPLPWITHSLSLIRQAIDIDIPVLGHCLGGQLISKALGAYVYPNHHKEIGWGIATAEDNPTAHEWLNGIKQFNAFHWHGETFDLPPNAVHILKSQACPHQAYVLNHRHLAMQCHIEMTEHMIQKWCIEGKHEILAAQSSPYVQSAEQMQTDMTSQLSTLHHVADQLYQRWITGLSQS